MRNALQKYLPLVNKTTRVYVDNPSGGMRTVRMPNKLYVEIQKALASCEYSNADATPDKNNP